MPDMVDQSMGVAVLVACLSLAMELPCTGQSRPCTNGFRSWKAVAGESAMLTDRWALRYLAMGVSPCDKRVIASRR